MTDDGIITNKMLLQHMQAGNASLQQELREFKQEVRQELRRLEEKMDRGFAEARQDRENLREDLEATIMMQFRHQKQLAVLTGGPMPEDD